MNLFKSYEHRIIYEKLISFKEDNHVANSFSNDFVEISSYINEMKKYSAIEYYSNIQSRKKIIAKLIILAKKAIRKTLAWLIGPIIEQQTNYNVMSTNAVSKQTLTLKKHSDFITEFEKKSVNLDKRLIEFEKRCESFAEKVSLIDENSRIALKEIQSKVEDLELKLQFLVSNNLNYEADCTDIFAAYNNANASSVRVSYSQAGEDSIISYITKVKGISAENITYLDLGANHAMELSNTYYFYSRGASGVLVEANPTLIIELETVRHRDIVLNKCIDVVSGKKIPFYVLSGDGLSTPDIESAKKFCEVNPNLKIVDTVMVETITVNDIIENYMPKAPIVLSIDIEGKEIEIIDSINFDKTRPLIIITEMISYGLDLTHGSKNMELYELLTKKGYEEYAFTGINSIFIDSKASKKFL